MFRNSSFRGPPGRPPVYRYFLAFLLPGATRATVDDTRRRYGLRRKLVPTARLHKTLVVSEDYDEPQPRLASRAMTAMDGLALGSCTVSLDTLYCTDGWAGLAPRRRLSDLAYVQRCIERCVTAAGFPVRHRFRFNPHVTLAYGHGAGPTLHIPPIGWAPDEVVLIESWVGRTRYRVLGRWPLGNGVVPIQHGLAF